MCNFFLLLAHSEGSETDKKQFSKFLSDFLLGYVGSMYFVI